MCLCLQVVGLSTLQGLSSAVLLTSSSVFWVSFWVSVGLAAAWCFFTALPSVVEDMTELQKKGTLEANMYYCTICHFLGTHAYILIVFNLLKPFACVLADDVDLAGVTCWDEQHQTLLMVGGTFLVFYVLTAHVLTVDTGISRIQAQPSLTLRYSQVYLVFTRVCFVMCAVVYTLFSSAAPDAVFATLTVGLLMLIAFTAVYQSIYAVPLGSFAFLKPFRIGAYVTTLVGVVFVWLLQGDIVDNTTQSTNTLFTVVLSVLALVTIALAYRVHVQAQLESTEVLEGLRAIRKRMYVLEQQLYVNSHLSSGWTLRNRDQWLTACQAEAISSRETAQLILTLEAHVNNGVLEGSLSEAKLLREWRAFIEPTWHVPMAVLEQAVTDMEDALVISFFDCRLLVPKPLQDELSASLQLKTDHLDSLVTLRDHQDLETLIAAAEKVIITTLRASSALLTKLVHALPNGKIIIYQEVEVLPVELINIVCDYLYGGAEAFYKRHYIGRDKLIYSED